MANMTTLQDAFLAIGEAHAGKKLTHEELMVKLMTDAAFRKLFNGPPPRSVTFPDEETAKAAVEFENKAVRSK